MTARCINGLDVSLKFSDNRWFSWISSDEDYQCFVGPDIGAIRAKVRSARGEAFVSAMFSRFEDELDLKESSGAKKIRKPMEINELRMIGVPPFSERPKYRPGVQSGPYLVLKDLGVRQLSKTVRCTVFAVRCVRCNHEKELSSSSLGAAAEQRFCLNCRPTGRKCSKSKEWVDQCGSR